MSFKCYVCGHEDAPRIHVVKEMLQGLRHSFPYAECQACGYLSLEEVPQDLSPYYEESYYSLREQGYLKSKLKAMRGAHAFGRRNLLSHLLVRRFGYPPVVGWLQKIPATTAWRVLDVGCGQGIALRDLAMAGFAALDGIDPYLSSDRRFGPVRLKKATLAEVQGPYDLIMLNHSFEHLPDQRKVLSQLDRLLSPGGWLLIRIPVLGEVWQSYGVHSYGLHAPRHFSMHTLKSFEILLEDSPFTTKLIEFDSDEHHYLASEQFKRDIPHTAANSYIHGLEGSIFDEAALAEARRKAVEANRRGVGDQASFYLQRK